MTLREKLLAASRQYCQITGKSFSALSNMLFDDGKSLDRIAGGGDCMTRQYEKAMEQLREKMRKEKTRHRAVNGTKKSVKSARNAI